MKIIVLFLGLVVYSLAAPKPKDLSDDFNDILALFPIEDMQAILNNHLVDDGALNAVVVYLQSDEWHQLVDEIGQKQTVQDFLDYLTEAGIPARDIVQLIHEFLESLTPGEVDENGSLRSFLDEVEAIIPVDDIVAVIADKMLNSPDFQEFYTKISSEKSHDLVEEVLAIEEVQRLIGRLEDFDAHVTEALQFIFAFLGWDWP